MIYTLLRQIKNYKKPSILSILFTALEVALELMLPLLTAAIIDDGIEAGNMNSIYFYGMAMLAAAVSGLASGVLSGRYAAIASAGVAANLRCRSQSSCSYFR